jgi:hypothetical protein
MCCSVVAITVLNTILVSEYFSVDLKNDSAMECLNAASVVNYTGCNETKPNSPFAAVMEADQLANYSSQSEESCRVLTFVYSKKIHGCDSAKCAGDRKSYFTSVVDPGKRRNDTKAQQAYQTLRMLVSPTFNGDVSSDEIPNGTMSFARFMHRLPEWSDKDTSFIFHRDDPSVRDKANVLLQRVQNSGNCYFHASAMLQHYWIAKHNTQNMNPGILDITAFVSRSFGSGALQNYIFENKGDNTVRFLVSILEPGSKLEEYLIETIDEGVLRRWRLFLTLGWG